MLSYQYVTSSRVWSNWGNFFGGEGDVQYLAPITWHIYLTFYEYLLLLVIFILIILCIPEIYFFLNFSPLESTLILNLYFGQGKGKEISFNAYRKDVSVYVDFR
jgi:hypothetical protein